MTESMLTSATADLSAGGVATALNSSQPPAAPADRPHSVPTQEPVVSTRGDTWPEADPSGERIGLASRSETYPYPVSPAPSSRGLLEPKRLGIGAGALLSLGSAIGGAWLYARWQRERNKPINRFRRGASDLAHRLGERVPELVDELPSGAAPVSGAAASALLLTALIGSRAMRRSADDHTDEVRDRAAEMLADIMRESLGLRDRAMDRRGDAIELGRTAMDVGRELLERRGEALGLGRELAGRRTEVTARIEPSQPTFMGLGMGGLAIVAGAGYFIWRALRGGRSATRPNWYAGE
jgi:hypothetical protein